MASLYDPILGPYYKHAFAKSVVKGEDTWLQQKDVSLAWKGAPANVDANIFGVFDGHGGKQAAQYASRNLLGRLRDKLGASEISLISHSSSGSSSSANLSPCLSAESTAEAALQAGEASSNANDDTVPEQLRKCDSISSEAWDTWHAQDAVVDTLPRSLSSTFASIQEDFLAGTKVSGTTATVAAFVGWELIVANVGDSLAYLDTGSEVIQVSGNHRLDVNKSEQARLRSVGCEVVQSAVGARHVGPLRVWPGGLAMSRTLGDLEAGQPVLAEPEVRQVTLPHTGGRLIMASDGLWDAVQPKTAAHHVRNLAAGKAASELVQMALRHKGARDDITVIVVDAMSSSEDRLPCLLQRTGNGSLQADNAPAHTVSVLKPLELQDSCRPWYPLTWQLRLAAVDAAFDLSLSKHADAPESSECSDDTVFLDTVHCSEGVDEDAAASQEDSMHVVPETKQADQLEEVQQDDWLPVKTKKHALHVGSPDSGTEWPVRSPAKATRKDTAGHEHRTARPSTLNNKPQQASSAAAAVQLPSRSTWPGNASSAESEQPVQQQQRKSGPDRRSRGGHRPSRPRRSWPMSRIDEVPEGSIQPDIPDAANARGIRAVHAVQGYMSHAGSSLSPRVGMLPDVTSNGPVPEPDRRAQGVIGNGRYRRPREAPQHRQQQGGTSAISLSHPAPSGMRHTEEVSAAAAPASQQGLSGHRDGGHGDDPGVPSFQFGGAVRYAVDGSDLGGAKPALNAQHRQVRQQGRPRRSRAS